MIEENKRVLLGMSGGTDSSVAAMRLLEAGYEVIGVTFRFYELNGSTEYLEDARNLAERLGIRHITYDAREIFARQIIEYFVQEYLAGRTPVPCTLCNNYLKWPLLAKIADEMGVFYIATGHYAQNIQLNETFYITYAADSDKDQTFFLWIDAYSYRDRLTFVETVDFDVVQAVNNIKAASIERNLNRWFMILHRIIRSPTIHVYTRSHSGSKV